MKLKANPILKMGAFAALCVLVLSGCKSVHSYNSRHDTTYGKKDKVQNVHRGVELPAHLRRVALLPLARGRYDHIAMEGIRENFVQEIGKRNLFEVVAIEPEEMDRMFGAPEFTSIEHLPTTLLSKLHTAYAIDGVMLIDISYYNAYQPVGIGVRAKLLDGHTGEIVWAADEVFDSANPAVSNAARKYFQTQSVNQYPLQQTQTVLHSPTRFSKYVANAIFSTIQSTR